MLELSSARVEADIIAFLERNEADAVELPLEGPLRTGEPVLSERRGNGLDPFGELRASGRGRVVVGAGHSRGPAVHELVTEVQLNPSDTKSQEVRNAGARSIIGRLSPNPA